MLFPSTDAEGGLRVGKPTSSTTIQARRRRATRAPARKAVAERLASEAGGDRRWGISHEERFGRTASTC